MAAAPGGESHDYSISRNYETTTISFIAVMLFEILAGNAGGRRPRRHRPARAGAVRPGPPFNPAKKGRP
jgi:hypothetical protein